MIVFDLKCKNGHRFEGWFEDNGSFENQRRKKLIACPICDDVEVCKVPSVFGIKTSTVNSPLPPKVNEMEILGKKLYEFVEKNFDDVGCEFTKEALKIHYGATEPRNIRGVSTEQEEKVLKEEGVKFFKIPSLTSSKSDS
ncbi:MAG: DUF1178 family protein [Thermodesulfobacteriota bacterium]